MSAPITPSTSSTPQTVDEQTVDEPTVDEPSAAAPVDDAPSEEASPTAAVVVDDDSVDDAGTGDGSTGGAAAFVDLGLRPELLTALDDLGHTEPTPVQARAIPTMLGGADLLARAATGTGKTGAFVLPVLQRLADARDARSDDDGPAPTGPAALVLAPTRELAVQVAEAATRYGARLGARVLAVYGGAPIGPQLRALSRGVDVVVATPGRAIDHLERGSLDLSHLATLVLDEADEMLDMGFADDLETILAATPRQRQTALFSATLPPRIDRIARRHLRDPVRLTVDREELAEGEAPAITQRAHLVARAWKPAALRRVLDVEAPTAAIVFCRSRGEVDELTEALTAAGLRAEALHGGLGQEARDRVMNRLRGGSAQLLVATDVAARGLDVEQLTHVVNYDVPISPESYVHRIGRVGRGGRAGTAITLAEPRDARALAAIERTTSTPLPLVPLPGVAELRAVRAQRTRDALADVISGEDAPAVGSTRAAAGSLDRWRDLVDAMVAGDDGPRGAAPLDARDVAAAALEMLEAASGRADEVEIPAPHRTKDRPTRTSPGGSRGEGRRPVAGAGHGGHAAAAGHGAARRAGGSRERLSGDTTKLWFGLGAQAGVRPQDLVGAIANESPLSGRDIGTIHVRERFSLVEVPSGAADDVVAALSGSLIRGRKAAVRRDRD